MKFEAIGVFVKKGEEKKFRKELEAASEKLAVEKVLSLMGSEHNVKRRFIKISEIKELKE